MTFKHYIFTHSILEIFTMVQKLERFLYHGKNPSLRLLIRNFFEKVHHVHHLDSVKIALNSHFCRGTKQTFELLYHGTNFEDLRFYSLTAF